MAVARSRVLDLIKVQCRIYGHSYNPTCIRTGNKILRQRLKGPTLAAYYPRIPYYQLYREMQSMYPDLETYDDAEAERLDSLAITKARGKGPPKKKRTKEESKKSGKRKPAAPVRPPPPT